MGVKRLVSADSDSGKLPEVVLGNLDGRFAAFGSQGSANTAFPGPRPVANATPLASVILSNRGGASDDPNVPKNITSGVNYKFGDKTLAEIAPWFAGGGTVVKADWNGNATVAPTIQGGGTKDIAATLWSTRFITTSPWLLWRAQLYSGAWDSLFQIKVNGVPLWDTKRDLGGSFIGYFGALYLEFRDTTPKLVEIFHTAADVFDLTWATGTTTAPVTADAKRKRVAIIGDSWNAGTSQAGPVRSYAHALAVRSSWEVLHQGQGGTGYVSGASSNDYSRVYGDPLRLQAYMESKPDMLVVVGSINDSGKAGIRSACESLLAAVHTASPATKVLLVGAQLAWADNVNQELRAAATADPSGNVIGFVDPPAEGWAVEGVTGVADGAHPSPAGAEFWAYLLEQAIRSAASKAAMTGW